MARPGFRRKHDGENLTFLPLLLLYRRAYMKQGGIPEAALQSYFPEAKALRTSQQYPGQAVQLLNKYNLPENADGKYSQLSINA